MAGRSFPRRTALGLVRPVPVGPRRAARDPWRTRPTPRRPRREHPHRRAQLAPAALSGWRRWRRWRRARARAGGEQAQAAPPRPWSRRRRGVPTRSSGTHHGEAALRGPAPGAAASGPTASGAWIRPGVERSSPPEAPGPAAGARSERSWLASWDPTPPRTVGLQPSTARGPPPCRARHGDPVMAIGGFNGNGSLLSCRRSSRTSRTATFATARRKRWRWWYPAELRVVDAGDQPNRSRATSIPSPSTGRPSTS